MVNGDSKSKGPLTNGTANTPGHPASATSQDKSSKSKYQIQPLSGMQPLKLSSENVADLHLLAKEEAELCSVLRINPKPYLVIKEAIMKEAIKNGGSLKRKGFKDICKVRCSHLCNAKFPWSCRLNHRLTYF